VEKETKTKAPPSRASLLGIEERISKQEINQLPLARFPGRIHLVTTPAAVTIALEQLMQSRILGFDTESRPSFRKGDNFLPSVVQFADADSAYIFQVSRLGGIEGIKPLLENAGILKVGVALHDDIKRLQEIATFVPGGITEIATLSKALGIENTGLRSLVALLLRCRISKGAQVSNWARRTLSQNQLNYAATDAWISRELSLKLLVATEEAKRLQSA